jgi:predicted PhzF superfamily epimerase YddE/YHI9
MQGRDGEIETWQENGLTWARARLSIMPPWNFKQLESTEAVERITLEDTKTWQHTMAWAWIDEAKGLIRARTFASDWDIPEAQGNGSGSMVLAARLNREIEIRHGKGAVIFAKPAPDGQGDIGGRVVEEIDAE